MKKLLAILLTVAMILSMAVVVSADQIVTVVEYDFESGSQIDNWEHHWGRGQLSLVEGRLHTEKADQNNIMFTTFTKLSQTFKAGVTYTVSADIILCGNTYFNGTDRVTIAEDDTVSFRMGLRTDLDGDNVEVIGSNVTVKPSDSETATFNYTPTQDVTDLLLCFNMSGSDWKYNGVSYCIDNVRITYTETDTVEFTCALLYDNLNNDNATRIYIETTALEYNESLVLKLVDANGNVLTETMRNPDRAKSYPDGISASIFIKGECTDGWLQTSWTPEADKAPKAVEMYIDGTLVATRDVDYSGYDWATSDALGVKLVGNAPVESTGYFSTGDETHAVIINGAIITSNHEFNANGDCIYCGHHKDLEEDEVVIETPVESTEEEVDTDDTEDTVDVEETEDTNPTTGIALAVVPMMVAAAAVVASKRR